MRRLHASRPYSQDSTSFGSWGKWIWSLIWWKQSRSLVLSTTPYQASCQQLLTTTLVKIYRTNFCLVLFASLCDGEAYYKFEASIYIGDTWFQLYLYQSQLWSTAPNTPNETHNYMSLRQWVYLHSSAPYIFDINSLLSLFRVFASLWALTPLPRFLPFLRRSLLRFSTSALFLTSVKLPVFLILFIFSAQ